VNGNFKDRQSYGICFDKSFENNGEVFILEVQIGKKRRKGGESDLLDILREKSKGGLKYRIHPGRRGGSAVTSIKG
jgi:hypothetical protein